MDCGPATDPVGLLEKHLQNHLSVNQDRVRLQCHVLSDHYLEADWAEESLPSAFISPTEFLQSRHLILVSQGGGASVTGSPEQKKRAEATVIVTGLCVVEYAVRGKACPSRCYIQYVDTTGLVRPRSLQGALTKNLLKAYVNYARDVLKVGCVHLFASPKPSLLFAGSEILGKKAVLNGKQLISWWLSLLTDCLASSIRHDVSTTLFAYSPGEELLPASARHTRVCLERLLAAYSSSSLRFQYGVPYKGDESALSHIPAFPDDPKWRHLEALLEDPIEYKVSRKKQRREQHESALTVREFFETLGYRSDFANESSALISVNFHYCGPDSGAHLVNTKKSDNATRLLEVMKTLSFDSEQEAVRSSSRILALLKIMNSPVFTLNSSARDENTDPDVHNTVNLFKETFAMLQPAQDTYATLTSSSSSVNSLQSPVCDLQGFIKRKLPRNL